MVNKVYFVLPNQTKLLIYQDYKGSYRAYKPYKANYRKDVL